MFIIAMDLSTSAGVALGRAGGTPEIFSETFDGSGQAAKFNQALDWALRLIDKHSPDIIVIEKAIATGPVGSEARVQFAFGYRAAVMIAAYRRGVRVKDVPVQTVRKHFLGTAKMRRDEAKRATMTRCKQLGWVVANDDEADACAVWDHTGSTMARRGAMPAGGLF